MTHDEAQRVCDAFGLGRFHSLQSLGGTRNRNFVFHTESGPWFVRRRFEGYCANGQIEFDHTAAGFLHARHVPTPLPRRTIDGASWWHDGEAAWEVLSFVGGDHLRDGNPVDVAALGAALGRWHEAGRTFPLRFDKAARRGETDPKRLLARSGQIEREAPPAEAAQTTGVLSPYRAAIAEAAAQLPDKKYIALPHTLIHGDVQPANILMHDGQVVAFVDLDWCAWQARIYDLCFAILVCCAAHDEPFDGGDIWSLTQPPKIASQSIKVFLESYGKRAAPLTPEEKTALRPQLVLTLCHARLSGSLKVAAGQRTRFLSRSPDLATSEWLPRVYGI